MLGVQRPTVSIAAETLHASSMRRGASPISAVSSRSSTATRSNGGCAPVMRWSATSTNDSYPTL